MLKALKNFKNDEDGAVTLDWVVLTAAVVGLGVAAYVSVDAGTTGLNDTTASYLTEMDRP